MRYGLKPRAVVLEGDKCLTPCPADHTLLPHEICILGEDGDIRHAHWPCEPWRVGFRVPALESAPDLAGPLPASLQHELGITMAHLVLPCASSGARPPEAYHASLHSLPPLRQVRPLRTTGPAFASSRAGRCPRPQHHGSAARPLFFGVPPGAGRFASPFHMTSPKVPPRSITLPKCPCKDSLFFL
jgi:hypothetical protein